MQNLIKVLQFNSVSYHRRKSGGLPQNQLQPSQQFYNTYYIKTENIIQNLCTKSKLAPIIMPTNLCHVSKRNVSKDRLIKKIVFASGLPVRKT